MENFYLSLDFHLGEPAASQMRQPPAELGSSERAYLGDRSVDGVTHDDDDDEDEEGLATLVGRCRLTVSKPELKARLVAAISA